MPSSRPYPIFLDLADRPVLIVGGGAVAGRKLDNLLECGAKVTIVSPRFSDDIKLRRNLRCIKAAYKARHMTLKKWRLVFAATDVLEVNALVQKHAAAAGILCCRCDSTLQGDSSDFSNGAAASVNGVTIALSTGGASPALARRLRDQAQAAIDPALAQLAGLMETWRPVIHSRLKDAAVRRLLLIRLASEEMESALRNNGTAAAKKLFQQWLKGARNTILKPGLHTRRTHD